MGKLQEDELFVPAQYGDRQHSASLLRLQLCPQKKGRKWYLLNDLIGGLALFF